MLLPVFFWAMPYKQAFVDSKLPTLLTSLCFWVCLVASAQPAAAMWLLLKPIPLANTLQSDNGTRAAAVAKALQLRNEGDDEGALQVLRQAAEALPRDPEILLDLGIQAHAMHRLTTASEALRAALAVDPANAKAIYTLARVETDQGHLDAAETHWKTYLRIRPDDASAHYGLGHLYQMQQQTEKAAAEFHQSIALLPVQTESYYQLGQMALDAHRDAEAKAMFTKTLERMPTHGGALTGMGILAYRAKDYSAALRSLTSAKTSSPEYQPVHYYLGLTLARLGLKEASQQELDKAAALTAAQQDKSRPVLDP